MRGERSSWKRWLGLERGAPAGSRTLAANETLRLPCRGAVRVEAGQVVITREGDPIDHVLGEGDALELPVRGRAVAWALAPSRVAVEPQGGSRLPFPRRRAGGERVARGVASVFAWRRRSSTAPSPSRDGGRPSAARRWPAPRPS